MNRHFALPIAFAAAFHGALLFGFTKKPRLAAPPPRSAPPIAFSLPPIEPEVPLVAESESASRESKPEIEVPQPRSPEPLTLDLGDVPTMQVPVFQAAVPGDARKIELPSGPVGVGIGDGGGQIIPKDWLDNSPRTRFQAAPIYPFEAKRQGLHGEVVVEFMVDEKGHVREPRVVSSSDRIFEEPSLRAVAKWLFEPGKRNGSVVRFKMAVPVVFTLSE